MSRPRYNLDKMLQEDQTVITAPADSTITVTTPDSDPSSLDIDPAPEPDVDTELEAMIRQIEADAVATSDDAAGPGATVTITEPGGAAAGDDGDCDDAADEIADATADGIDDSADEVAEDFETAEQSILLAQDIGKYGLTASGLAIGRAVGLLNGAAFTGLSEENLRSEPIVAGSRAACLSQESLVSAAADSVARFGARALGHAEGVSRRLLGMVNREDVAVLKAIRESRFTVPAVGEKVAQILGKPRTLGDVIKNTGTAAARPRNAAVALGIVAAIGGATALVKIAFNGAPAPGTPVAEMNAYFAKVRGAVSKIKWPFGKLDVKEGMKGAKETIRDRIGRLSFRGKTVSSASDAVKGSVNFRVSPKEWTEQGLKAFKDGFVRAMSELKQALTGGGEGFVRSIKAGFKMPAAEGAAKSVQVLTHGGYIAAIFSVFALVATTLYFVVAGGCRIIRRQLA